MSETLAGYAKGKAERVFTDLFNDRGPSSETYGILGRVYNDRWQDAKQEDSPDLARDMLNKAIDAYLGIIAATLTESAPKELPRDAGLGNSIYERDAAAACRVYSTAGNRWITARAKSLVLSSPPRSPVF